MFTQTEENYLKSLINTYISKGYKYYLCHTITESNNNYDVCLYVSKNEIKANNSYIFDLSQAICIYIDSSSRSDSGYNPSTHSRDIIHSDNVTGEVEINQAEFIYTNASYTYTESTLPVNPDLMLQGVDSYQHLCNNNVLIVLLVVMFLYTFFISILRVRR